MKSTGKSIFLRLPESLDDRLDLQVERMSTSKSALIRQGIVKVLEELESNEPTKRFVQGRI